MLFFEMTISCHISITRAQISYIKAANGCTGCTAPVFWTPFLNIYPLLPRPFIVSGLNEGVVHGQPFPGKLENSEAGNTKTCWE